MKKCKTKTFKNSLEQALWHCLAEHLLQGGIPSSRVFGVVGGVLQIQVRCYQPDDSRILTIAFCMSLTKSPISSHWAPSRLFAPARPFSLARYLELSFYIYSCWNHAAKHIILVLQQQVQNENIQLKKFPAAIWYVRKQVQKIRFEQPTAWARIYQSRQLKCLALL